MLLKSFIIITVICFYFDCDTSNKTAIFYLYYIDVCDHRVVRLKMFETMLFNQKNIYKKKKKKRCLFEHYIMMHWFFNI